MTTPKNDPYWQGPDERAGVPTEHDPVNHPRHYTSHPSGVECIDIVEHMTFCQGNAVKYLWRAGEKGDVVEDLRKAAWYATREAERLEKLRAPPCEVGDTTLKSRPAGVIREVKEVIESDEFRNSTAAQLAKHVATFQEDDGSTTRVNFGHTVVTYEPAQKRAKKIAKKGRAR